MYIIICKNKWGLSISATSEYSTNAEAIKDRMQRNRFKGDSFHVRKFDLGSINLGKLMEER